MKNTLGNKKASEEAFNNQTLQSSLNHDLIKASPPPKFEWLLALPQDHLTSSSLPVGISLGVEFHHREYLD